MTAERIGRRRTAFTLIELLVVIAIIGVLAALTIAILPRIGPADKTARGASQLQGWLAIAKQRAYRDKIPRGIRMIVDPNDGHIHKLVYVEQPDDYSAGSPNNTAMKDNANNPINKVSFTLPAGADFNNVCQVNDYLVLGNDLYKITALTANTLQITPNLKSDVYSTFNYRILRKPRDVDAEAELQMPSDIAIDRDPFPGAGNPKPPMPADFTIVFSPTGGVMQEGASMGKFILYVRDVTMPSPLQGDPTLITVYTRTGAIAAHPVNQSDLTQPWLFTQDGRSSGM